MIANEIDQHTTADDGLLDASPGLPCARLPRLPSIIPLHACPRPLLLSPPIQSLQHAVLTSLASCACSCPLTGFWGTWKNSLYQLKLLDTLSSLPVDTFSFMSLPSHRIVSVESVVSASPTIKSLVANVRWHTWNSLDLFDDSQTQTVQTFDFVCGDILAQNKYRASAYGFVSGSGMSSLILVPVSFT